MDNANLGEHLLTCAPVGCATEKNGCAALSADM